MKIWKEVISPGEVFYTGADGKPAKLDATPEDIRYWHDQGKAMLASGLSIPIPLEHDTDCLPLTVAEKAAKQLKSNTGWVEDYAIRPGDKLYSLCNVEDEEAARKLPSTIKFTSPWLNSFQDGNGKKWDGVITHLALTNRPRIVRQEPFKLQNIAAALSLLPAQATTRKALPAGGIAISRAGILDKGKPRFQGAFSIWSGVKLDTNPLPSLKKKEAPADDEKPKGEEKPPPKSDKPAEKLVDTDVDVPEDEMDTASILCDLLSIYGFECGEDMTEENCVQRVIQAVMAKLKSEKDMETPPDKNKPPAAGTPPPGPTIQEAPPMYMSLADIKEKAKTITDPVTRQLFDAMLAVQEKEGKTAQALRQNALDAAKVRRDQRVERLAKRLSPGTRDALLAQVKDAKLSLGDDGVVKDDASVMLDMMEKTIKDVATDVPELLRKDYSFLEQPHPEEFNGGISDERAEKLAEEISKKVGSPLVSSR
jgi:hypothetical protein